MKTLHLTLKKKWFDMILSGEKKEEYREIKDYWVRRLCKRHPQSVIDGGDLRDKHKGTNYSILKFDRIEFKNGYAKNAPTMTVECRGIEIGMTKSHWCEDGEKEVFVIKLGRVLFHKNCG